MHVTFNNTRFLPLAAILLAFAVSTGNASKIAAGEKIDWQVLSGGGDRQTSTSLVLNFTVGQTATGTVSSLNFRVKQGYWQDFVQSCCVGRVGDANSSGDDEPTIGDVTTLIDAKFITGTCDGILFCLEEADINQSAAAAATCDDVTIGDITILIDYLFITGPSLGLPNCL